MSNDAINAHLPELEGTAILAFYVLDATAIGGGFFRFYTGTTTMNQPVVWQGNTYTPMPVECRGFEYKGTGAPPRPSIVFGNVGGAISALCINFDDLIGAKLIRKRTFFKFLDGQPGENPTQLLPDDIFYIERKVDENKGRVEFEIATNLEIDDVAIPQRQFIANLCPWRYRSGECTFTDDTVKGDLNDHAPGIALTNRGEWDADADYTEGDFVYLETTLGRAYYWVFYDAGGTISGEGAAPSNTTFWKKDECSKRVAGCVLRFGGDPAGLPFGGFPAADRQS